MHNRRMVRGIFSLLILGNLTQMCALPGGETVGKIAQAAGSTICYPLRNILWFTEGVFCFNTRPFTKFIAENKALSLTGATLVGLVGALYWRQWANAQANAKVELLQALENILHTNKQITPQVTNELMGLASKCYEIPAVSPSFSDRYPYSQHLRILVQKFIDIYQGERQHPPITCQRSMKAFNDIKAWLLGKFII